MATITIAGWTVDVDLARTQAYYASRPTWSETCGCAYCRNFVMAYRTGHIPERVLAILELVGIELSKDVGEVYQYNENSDGTHCYGGFYHVAGTIVAENPHSDKRSGNGDSADVPVSIELHLLATDFPRPAIQVEFIANIPWVLPEAPESQ